MTLVVEKKKNEIEQTAQKSKGLNGFLWFLVVALILVASVGNIYFAGQYSTPVRVVAIFVLIVITLILAAITNQGKKALAFFSEARTELRRITWPTRPEAMQTTFIVVAVTVVTSLILWGFDSVIVSVLNFLTDLRF
ncbi:preprotein translocase subunit SecE [Bisgaard Taxon 10/6]|uniref:Protein translocase subunit SecE n=1 Tax=Exercitatus varius TaxID=67857 RepID=A0ABT6ETK5_9PAST|nr:preprotein translocase subunit SecE [Exercitatus varius]MDG2946887.1 preprotein translocase subunit SecE [Exercitatus varius]